MPLPAGHNFPLALPLLLAWVAGRSAGRALSSAGQLPPLPTWW
ncbi:MAG: hypothetical protein ACT4PP_16090 [Sporichthyaceae bacterium]